MREKYEDKEERSILIIPLEALYTFWRQMVAGDSYQEADRPAGNTASYSICMVDLKLAGQERGTFIADRDLNLKYVPFWIGNMHVHLIIVNLKHMRPFNRWIFPSVFVQPH